MPSFRAEKRRLLSEAWSEAHRSKVTELRASVAKIGERRKAAMARAVTVCRARRVSLRARLEARRAELRAIYAAEKTAAKEAARCACDARKLRVKKHSKAEAEKLRATLRAEAVARADELRHLGRRKREQRESVRYAQGQQTSEEVERELPAELLPVWRRTAKQFRGSERRSRVEAFLQWVEENPGEVVRLQDQNAEREARRLVRELRTVEAERPSPKKVARELRGELVRLGLKGPGIARAVRRLAGGSEPTPDVVRLVREHAERAPLAFRALELAARAGAVPF